MERGSFPAAESSFTKALAILLLLTTHEVGHAWTAWKLGDDTAMSQGRISLNPLRHLDPVGSVLLPALLLWRNEEVNLVVCLAAFLLLLVACLGVRTAWPGVTTFHLAQPFGAMAVAGLPSPRAVGGVLLFLVLVMTPVFNIFVAIPAGLTWGLLHLSLAAMGFG